MARAMEQTLLLNATYEPLRVVHWQKAITLWSQGKVEIVAHYDREIRSVSLQHQAAVGDPAAAAHPDAQDRGVRAVLAREHLRARQPHLSVLRPRVSHERADVRPRHAGRAGRPQGLGEHRHLLHHAAIAGRADARPSRPACTSSAPRSVPTRRRRFASRSACATRPRAGATTSTGTSS